MTDVSRSSRDGPNSAKRDSLVVADATVIDGAERRPALAKVVSTSTPLEIAFSTTIASVPGRGSRPRARMHGA